jgi:hypothetical protein
MPGLNLNNPPKLYLLVMVLAGVFALMLFDRIDAENAQAWGLIGAITGYGIGNGIAAKNDETVEPVFTRKPTDTGSIRFDLVAGWLILIGGSIACAWMVGWLIIQALA